MAFRGLYEHSLDSKDRLTVPSRFRAALSDGVVLSKGFDPCVWVHTTAEFEQLSDRFLAPHSPFGKDARSLRRRFHGGSFDDKLDSAGRDPPAQAADRARRPLRPLRRDRRRRVPRDLERRGLGQAGGRARRDCARNRRGPGLGGDRVRWPPMSTMRARSQRPSSLARRRPHDRTRHSFCNADRAQTRPRHRAGRAARPAARARSPSTAPSGRAATRAASPRCSASAGP